VKKKPTLADKIAAWKQAKDIVLDELLHDRVARLAGVNVMAGSLLASDTALIAEASRTAVLMAPWSVEED